MISAIVQFATSAAEPSLDALGAAPGAMAWEVSDWTGGAQTPAFSTPIPIGSEGASGNGGGAPWVLSASAVAIKTRVLSLLAEASVDEGLSHPIDKILQATALRQDGGEIIQAIMLGNYYVDDVFAGLLRSLSRASQIDALWSEALVIAGLRHPSVEVREAAVGLVEAWASLGMIGVLRKHRESVGWLAGYTSRVLAELA